MTAKRITLFDIVFKLSLLLSLVVLLLIVCTTYVCVDFLFNFILVKKDGVGTIKWKKIYFIHHHVKQVSKYVKVKLWDQTKVDVLLI